jgi:hypothetical protein
VIEGRQVDGLHRIGGRGTVHRSTVDRDLVPDGEFFFGEVRDEGLDLFLAELGLDGRLRPVSGVLPAILTATGPGPVAWLRHGPAA